MIVIDRQGGRPPCRCGASARGYEYYECVYIYIYTYIHIHISASILGAYCIHSVIMISVLTCCY